MAERIKDNDFTDGEERILWHAGKMLADANRSSVAQRGAADSMRTAEAALALLVHYARYELKGDNHQEAARALVGALVSGYLWICNSCLPEAVEESCIGGVHLKQCVVCGNAYARSMMKHVLQRNLPERFRA